jgi:phosphatidate cytidylyltransferase
MPALLVVTNDIFAYIFGKLFGKTQLISLSPNKTLEGFIGGFFSTIIFAIIVHAFINKVFGKIIKN